MSHLYRDESVLSWVFRQLNSTGVTTEKMHRLRTIIEGAFERTAAGTAKLYEIQPATLRGYVFMPSELYRVKYESFWPIVPFYKRVSYCPQCILSDMHSLHECYWRADWEHYWCVICLHHGVRMVDIPNTDYTFETYGNKFGDAFADALRKGSIDQYLFFHARHEKLPLSPRHLASLKPDTARPIMLFKLAISSLALTLQRFLVSHLLGESVKFGCLAVVQDLMRLAMRPTTEFCDSFPIAHLLSQRQGLIKYKKIKWTDIDVDELLHQADRYSSVWIRLIAMGVTCYVLRLERSSYWWAQVVQSCRQLGHSLPDSPEDVYLNLLDGSFWGLRAWFETRHGAGHGFRTLFGDRLYGI